LEKQLILDKQLQRELAVAPRRNSIDGVPWSNEQMGTLAGSLDWPSQKIFAGRDEFISPVPVRSSKR
jgi:hypothetical protein